MGLSHDWKSNGGKFPCRRATMPRSAWCGVTLSQQCRSAIPYPAAQVHSGDHITSADSIASVAK